MQCNEIKCTRAVKRLGTPFLQVYTFLLLIIQIVTQVNDTDEINTVTRKSVHLLEFEILYY